MCSYVEHHRGGIGASLGTGAEEDLNKGRVCGDADLFFKILEAINSGEDCFENDLVYCGPAPEGHVRWAQQGMDLKKGATALPWGCLMTGAATRAAADVLGSGGSGPSYSTCCFCDDNYLILPCFLVS